MNGVGQGGIFVFNRTQSPLGPVWTQFGDELVGTGGIGKNPGAGQGMAQGVSGDGQTLVIGGPSDSVNQGAVWTFQYVKEEED